MFRSRANLPPSRHVSVVGFIARMTLPEAIAEAVQLFRAKLPTDEIVGLLTAMGIPRAEAEEIIAFLPLVYAREILRRSGCSGFSDHYTRRTADGTTSSPIALSRKPVWRACEHHLGRDLGEGAHGDDLVAIAVHSAEFKAAHQMLDTGSDIDNLFFPMPTLSYPDDGPLDS